jgi:biotin--protein ligase
MSVKKHLQVIAQELSTTQPRTLSKFVHPKYSLDVFSSSSLPQRSGPRSLDLNRYYAELKTVSMGRTFVYADSLSSTQTVLNDVIGEEVPAGTVCATYMQESGKGRGENIWTSPEGSLCFSVKLQTRNSALLPFMQYIVAITMIETTNALCLPETITNPPWEVRIKWPNDIYAVNNLTSERLKVGGILCQSSYMSGIFDVCVGVGMNLTNAEPSTSLAAVYQANLTAQDENATLDLNQLSTELVLARFLNSFETNVNAFEAKGFKEPFMDRYKALWLHSDQAITIKDEAEERKVKIAGLTKYGYLKAIDAEGTVYNLHPDANSFDMNKLQITKKVYPSKRKTKRSTVAT